MFTDDGWAIDDRQTDGWTSVYVLISCTLQQTSNKKLNILDGELDTRKVAIFSSTKHIKSPKLDGGHMIYNTKIPYPLIFVTIFLECKCVVLGESF